jgi:6-phosphogluconolactonase
MRQPLVIVAFETREALMRAAADRMADLLLAAINERGSACAALSGGSTPEQAYALLAKKPLDWSKVTFALVDERCVPPDHPVSNEAMLRRALAPALQKGATLIPMFTPGAADPAAAANQAHQALQLDIALMGMGADAHTASWFPAAAGLEAALDPASTQTVIAIEAPQAAGASARLTLTRAAIARAAHVVLLITGNDKRARLERAMSEPDAEAPVAALFDEAMAPVEVLWAA